MRDDTDERPAGQARSEPAGAPGTEGAAISPRDTATGQVRPTDGPMERAGTEAEARERGEPLPATDLRERRTGTAEPSTNEPLGPDDRPDVGLAQSGSGEDAVVRRETEI